MSPEEFVNWMDGYIAACEYSKFDYQVDIWQPIKNKLAEVEKAPHVTPTPPSYFYPNWDPNITYNKREVT